MQRTPPAIALLVSLLIGPMARGATIDLTITDAALAPGGTATVDVLISSPDGAVLDVFGLEVRVEAVGGQRLEFASPPADGQLADPGYLFFGDSTAALSPPAGVVVSTLAPGDTYLGGDGTDSGLGVEVPGTPTLLARLVLEASRDAPPGPGSAFTVSIVPGSASTFFLDPTFEPIPLAGLSSGTVTVVGFIPEPSTLVLTSGGVALLGLVRRARGRPRE
ncbi:PEP-CTERM sorting domain-containing protein [Tautonia plasticadhaerens]|uniref:PEP-CTERM protein-sorting domain-containing protein n=1 Tax=Tautonia plasticadhaerens TaxID=2527974 RepID=A0A518HDY8_9BACT|nr:PEP-CTERM sorting domain-containing protein [Tautonia plasticadhaerens]QDV39064.1 hypothetical protein ElP_70270 [Tautonia plasticadhaerens]